MVDSEKMAERCLMAAALAALFLSIFFWGNWFVVVGAWVLAFPFALLLGLIVGFAGNAMGYEIEDQSHIWTDETEILVTERSPETVGKFQGEDIHEWVMLKRPDNGELIRLVYHHTIDMRNEGFSFEPPDNEWFCILPPGIMYVQPEPENTDNEAHASE